MIGKTSGADKARQALRRACADLQSQKRFCERHRIARSTLSDILNGRKIISDRIARAVGFERVTVYRALK